MALSISTPQSTLLPLFLLHQKPLMSFSSTSLRQLRPLRLLSQRHFSTSTSTILFSQQIQRSTPSVRSATSNANPARAIARPLSSFKTSSSSSLKLHQPSNRQLTILSSAKTSNMASTLYTDETPDPVKNATGLHLITQSTPNGQKVQILLEELKALYDISYTHSIINIGTNEQKKDWFLRLNPNGRIPVLVDNTATPAFPIMETSAELLYLQEKYDKDNQFGFDTAEEKNQLLQWLFFWHGSGAPYQGQVNHFAKFAQEKVPYAIERFKNETLRVYGVLEIHLSGKYTGSPREYLAGNGKGKYSVADIGTWPWINIWKFSGAITDEDMAAFPHLLQWIDRIKERPAVAAGTGDNYNAQKRPDLYVGEKR